MPALLLILQEGFLGAFCVECQSEDKGGVARLTEPSSLHKNWTLLSLL